MVEWHEVGTSGSTANIEDGYTLSVWFRPAGWFWGCQRRGTQHSNTYHRTGLAASEKEARTEAEAAYALRPER